MKTESYFCKLKKYIIAIFLKRKFDKIRNAAGSNSFVLSVKVFRNGELVLTKCSSDFYTHFIFILYYIYSFILYYIYSV